MMKDFEMVERYTWWFFSSYPFKLKASGKQFARTHARTPCRNLETNKRVAMHYE